MGQVRGICLDHIQAKQLSDTLLRHIYKKYPTIYLYCVQKRHIIKIVGTDDWAFEDELWKLTIIIFFKSGINGFKKESLSIIKTMAMTDNNFNREKKGN